MNVELLNPEEVKSLFANWGQTSAICYDSHGNNEKIGIHCLKSGHFSGSRGDYIKFLVTDVPRLLIDQAVRHEVGVFKNVQSFRYVDKSGFSYEIPKALDNNTQLMNEYVAHMEATENIYHKIQDYMRSAGNNKESVNETARYVLPMATKSAFIIGFDIEALINFMHKRLCVRAESPIRNLAIQMRNCVLDVLPQLQPYLVPNCEYLLWCPENKQGCGRYPTKEEVFKRINE